MIVNAAALTSKGYDGPGCYALRSEGRIVYVGLSRNMRSRIRSHRTNGRPFDDAVLFPASLERLAALEAELIGFFCPAQNVRVPQHLKARTHRQEPA